MFNNLFENHDVYEINVEKYCKAGQPADGNIWHMRNACWITKATTDTKSM